MTTIGSIEIPTREIRNYTIWFLYIPSQLGALLDFCCSDLLISALLLGLIADFFFCLPLRNVGCMFCRAEVINSMHLIFLLTSLLNDFTFTVSLPKVSSVQYLMAGDDLIKKTKWNGLAQGVFLGGTNFQLNGCEAVYFCWNELGFPTARSYAELSCPLLELSRCFLG